jgi:hypothetical protein
VRLGVGDVVVGLDLLDDLLADPLDRVQRGHRVLEDHRDLRPADLAQLVLGGAQELGALVVRRAGERGVRRAVEAEQAQRGDRLARAGLAHDGEHLAGAQRQRDVVDGVDGALVGAEVDLEVLDVEQQLPARRGRRRGGGRG